MVLNPEKESINRESWQGRIPEEVVENIYSEKGEELKNRELLSDDEKVIREKLENEIAKIKLDPKQEKEAEKKRAQIEMLDEKEKVKRLLNLAEQKGLAFSVKVAKDMDDPYVLDVFHDILAKDRYFEKFEK